MFYSIYIPPETFAFLIFSRGYLEKSEKQKFQGVYKWNIGLKWVNHHIGQLDTRISVIDVNLVSEAYLENHKTSTKELLCKRNEWLSAIQYFH